MTVNRNKLTTQEAINVLSDTPSQQAYSATATVVPPSNATDIAVILGSPTKKVTVTTIVIDGVQSTPAKVPFSIIKRSTPNVGGTSTTPTIVKHDSRNSAPTATPLFYSSNPTTGISDGKLRERYVPMGSQATATKTELVINFGEAAEPIKLNSASESLSINLGGQTLSASAELKISFEWTEE